MRARTIVGWLALVMGCSDRAQSEPDEETGAEAEGGSAPFVDTPDGGGVAGECDLWAQDCPSGEKCMPWANDDGGVWNATRCTPIDGSPGLPGDPCTVQDGPTSGIDDCALGSMCWNVDDAGMGTCAAFCTGSPDDPQCGSPDEACGISNGGVLVLCLPLCDPLAQDCPVESACYPDERGFFCSPDASDDVGAFGDPCAYVNACDPGFWCAEPDDVADCPSEDGCCSAICDATSPDPCPGAGQVCERFWPPGSAPAGQDAAGLCVIPN